MTNRDHRGVMLHLDDFVGGYVTLVNEVMDRGEVVAPRGLATREVLGATIVIPADAPFLPVGTGRKVSPKMACEEALQLIGGHSDAEALFRVSDHMREYADQGAFHGAYGPRVRPQMDLVDRRLRDDPYSRRAVVTIWDPLRDSVEGVKNYPCTTELQFMLRPVGPHAIDCLDLHVTMRANDAWHGLAYDAYFFNQLQHSLARSLAVPVGTYYHHATSLHLYEPQWEMVAELSAPESTPAPLAEGIGKTGRPFSEAAQRARNIADGTLVPGKFPAGDRGERWYYETHAAIMGWDTE